MTRKSQIHIAVAIGTLFFVWLIAAQVAPLVSAAPVLQATLAPTTALSTPIPPAGNSGSQSYTIQAGDTLWSIATQFYGNGSKYTLIQQANNLPNNAILQVGSTLIIPANGETLPIETSQPSPTPNNVPSLVHPTAATNNPVPPPSSLTSTPVGVQPSSSASSPSSTTSPIMPIAGFFINALSVLCLLGSVACAFLSIDSYRRSKRYVQRDYIRKRIRVKA
jgi:LysM repeat protein